MSEIIQVSPTEIHLLGLDRAQLEPHLTYIDKSVDFELQKARHSSWLLKKLGEEGWREHLADLKAKRKQSILFEDPDGVLWTYSGLAPYLTTKFRSDFQDQVDYPDSKLIPWLKAPDKDPRPYQLQMKDLLLEARHGAVEVGTGLGKSFVILLIAKELGLKTVVMTPSVSIAEQMILEFETHLGKKYVGRFFGGKKDSKKQFVIGVDDSLSKISEGDEHWKNLRSTQVFLADESHLCPAKSLAKVCLGLLKNAPYRFFFSATQMRNDGRDLLLEGITGKIVFRMSVKDGVDQGYLARPMFRMVKVSSSSSYSSRDVNDMTRAHLYYNPEVNAKAGEIANLMIEELDRPTIILVQELEQFTYLLPHLRHRAAFAHGGVNKSNCGSIPKEYWDSDPTALVKEFNEGKLPILVGTSCITTGTDIKIAKALLYLQGGKSEIKVRQSIGRGTRKPPGKDDCFVIDFDPTNIDAVHRHAETRSVIYQDIYPDFEEFIL